jgi:outer membrane lipopolysaccharide assembly protein LptE/RlpB
MKKLFILLAVLLIAGCGYSTRSLLSDNYRTIFIQPFENKIDFVNADDRKLYVAGLEGRVREATVDRYLFDGNLRVGDEETADLVLKGKLIRFEREELRLQTNETVKEYRIRVTAALVLWDTAENKVLWEEPSFAGEATYYTTGTMAKSESQAIEEAIKDLAVRAVARTIENW